MDPEYSPESLQVLIGHPFENPDLLTGALTRFKYLGDKHLSTDNNMDPLATVGDAVLDLVVLQRLYNNGDRDTEILTEEKKKFIAKRKTKALADNIRYFKYIQWDSSEENEKIWESGVKTLDSCIEALIGAVYLDTQLSGGNGIVAVDTMLVKLGFSLPEKT